MNTLWYNGVAIPEKGERKITKGKITMGNRQGKHNRDSRPFRAYYPLRKKAIINVTAAHAGMSMTDLVWEGVKEIATRHGVLDDAGEVTDKFAPEVALAEAILKETGGDK